MADLDTRNKRASSVHILAPYILAPPLPDGALGTFDRQHIAWSYGGLSSNTFTPLRMLMGVGL